MGGEGERKKGREGGKGKKGKKLHVGMEEEGKRERTVFFLGPTQKRVSGEFLDLLVLQFYFS